MYCQKCGKEIDDSTNFCGYCGAKVESKNQSPEDIEDNAENAANKDDDLNYDDYPNPFWMKNYLISAEGQIANSQKAEYIIRANSEEEAKKEAYRQFAETYPIVDSDISVVVHKRTASAITSYVFLTIALFLSFVKWANGHELINIAPNFITTLYAAGLYGAFVVRFKGLSRTFKSAIDIMYAILIILLLGSIIHIILVEETFTILGFIKFNVSTNVVLIIAIILSWLGVKLASYACIGFVMVIGLLNMFTLNNAMGNIWGPMYVICAFIGISLYLSNEPEVANGIQFSARNQQYRLSAAQAEIIHAKNTAINKLKNANGISTAVNNSEDNNKKVNQISGGKNQ
jgi:hypothetical protein